MEIRPQCRRYFFSSIGKGDETHAWEDTWCNQGHLAPILTYRFINGNGLDTTSTVKDVVEKFGNQWPEEWRQRFPILETVTIPPLNDEEDRIFWLGPREEKQYYSVKGAWKTLHVVGPVVHWHKVVWNKAFIPKHALCMWMACQNRLLTQDRITQWKNDPPDLKCIFCKGTIETHDHLFFECTFSKAIWDEMKREIKLEGCPNAWNDILNTWMMGRWRQWSTLHKLAISATVYHIWLERNRRFFENCNQSERQIASIIKKEVLIKMAWKTACKTKNQNEVGR